ncbi:MAG: hypothetical protein IJU79_00045, partial [Desulfovibrionaceae bacterium]|nr:hypothetical protein [Desulfovibrionaceae bacterium]
VYTFENNGQVYITESSRSSGVHSMPYTDWYNERVKNGAQLYGVDVNRLRTSSDHNRGESTYANKTPSNEQTNAAKGQSLGFTGGLIDPNKAMVLQGRIDAGRRQHAAQANLTASAFDNHIAFGMETGDFSRAQNDLAALRRLGMHKEAENLDGLLTLAQTANGVLVNVNDLPLLEQRKIATKAFNPLITEDNAKHSTAMRDHIKATLQKKQESFIKDPAAYVWQFLQGDMHGEERIAKSLALQENIGKGLPFIPKVIAKKEADLLKAKFEGLGTCEERATFLYGLYANYGRYTQDALAEMQLPPTVAVLLPALQSLSKQDVGVCLTALVGKPSEFTKMELDERQQNAELTKADSFPMYQAALSLSQAFPNNDRIRNFARGVHTMAYNYLRLTGKTDLDSLNNAFSVSGDNGCFLILPSNGGYDANELSTTCKYYRESDNFKKKLLDSGALSANFEDDKTANGRINATNLNAILQNSIFVSTDDGKHLYVLDSISQQILRDKKGNAIIIDNKDVLKTYGKSAAWERFFTAQDTDEEE